MGAQPSVRARHLQSDGAFSSRRTIWSHVATSQGRRVRSIEHRRGLEAADEPRARFLNIAEASLAETEYHLLLSRDLGYLDADAHKSFANEASEISRMLFALRTKVDAGDRS
jgi:hypothetical protein